MNHYTFNTGHTRWSPREEVSDAALRGVAKLTTPGAHPLWTPFEGYELLSRRIGGGLLATLTGDRGSRPCISFAVAGDEAAADAVWPLAEKLYLDIGDLPGHRAADFAAPRRPAAPWCAAMTILATPDEAAWIADFERCVAWAFLYFCEG